MTIYYLCRDDNTPSGGRRILYRHVDILNAAGLNASIVHFTPDFRLTWFDNKTAVTHSDAVKITPEDYVVAPETFGPSIGDIDTTRLVIFNQNVHYTWAGYQGNETRTPYHGDNLRGVMTVSEHNKQLLSYMLPFLTVDRVVVGLDTDLFTYSDKKDKAIAYMPRRGSNDLGQVLQALKWRGALHGWELIPIHNMNHEQVAAALKRAAIFLSTGYQEGCPMPPLEAAACGCKVIGYTGYGGDEYCRDIDFWDIWPGDIYSFARAVEHEMAAFGQNDRRQASDYARTAYSPKHEQESVLSFWEQFHQSSWQEYQHYWYGVTVGKDVDKVTTHMTQAEYEEYYKPILAKLINGNGAATVYDIGCGGGMIVSSLKRLLPDMDYHGFDISPIMIGASKLKYPDYQWEVTSGFTYPPGADYLLCHSVFTHIYEEDAHKLLDGIKKALAPGGRASVSIHIDCQDGVKGNIGRIDYEPGYFEAMLKHHGLGVMGWIEGNLPHGNQRYYILGVA